MAGSRKRRHKADRTRRILAATLCAASFVTGHLVFGAEGAPSSRLSRYAAAREDLTGSASQPTAGLKPATVMPTEDRSSVADPSVANLAPIVPGDSDAPAKVPLIAAKPLPVGVPSALTAKPTPAAGEVGLAPIVSAASMRRPSQRKSTSGFSAKSLPSPAPVVPGAAARHAVRQQNAIRQQSTVEGQSAVDRPTLPGMQLNQFVTPQPDAEQPQQPTAAQSSPSYPVTSATRSPAPLLLPQVTKTVAAAQVVPTIAPVAGEESRFGLSNQADPAAYEESDGQAMPTVSEAAGVPSDHDKPLENAAPEVLTLQPPAVDMDSRRKAAAEDSVPAVKLSPTPALPLQPLLPNKPAPVMTPQAARAAVMPAASDNAEVESGEEASASDVEPIRPTEYTASAGTNFNSQPPLTTPSDDAHVEFGKIPEGSPFEAIAQSGTINLQVRRSLLMRTKVDIYRTAIVDDGIVELAQFTPREVSLIGRSRGQTHVTFWFDDPNMQPVTYLVNVSIDEEAVKADENKYKLLESVVNEMFPDSKVYLVLVADKLLVKGQARDSEEAAQIMSIIRAQSNNYGGPAGYNGLTQGAATPVLSMTATGNNPGPAYTIINMLRVPGVQQVALRVKIAELNRTAARGFGVDIAGQIDLSAAADGSKLFLASLLNASSGGGTALIAQVDGDDLNIGIRYAQQRGVIRLLSEPTLVTLSGQPATFIAGGEFAVPTVVGSVGLNAVTTDFRAFGAIISFLPTIVDKDRIRLQVAPEFSQINNALAVGGTPGLNVRAATTTVEMREGQTLAIAGLLEDTYKGTTVGDLPYLAQIFGRRDASHNETELIILVTPELVQPMEPEEVPPLPGFDVTEPNACEFFLHGDIEGNPTRDHRSTVWPRLRKRYGMGGPAMTSGPFGHGQ